MTNADARSARLAAGQNGMLTIDHLLGCGLTLPGVKRRKRSGLLIPMLHRVYRHAAVPLTEVGRLHALVLAAGHGAVASHRSAAWLHDLRDVPRARPEVTLPGSRTSVALPGRIHRTTLLEPADVDVVRQVPTTTVARTLLDLGAVVPYEVVELAAHDALIRNLVSEPQLLAVVERVAKRGRRGCASLRAVLRARLPDDRVESRLEHLLHQLLPTSPPPVAQHELTCTDGRRVRLDFAWPELRVAIEANGRRWHATARDYQRDLARRRSITASGWTHYEYGWADTTERAHAVRAEVAAVVERAVAA